MFGVASVAVLAESKRIRRHGTIDPGGANVVSSRKTVFFSALGHFLAGLF